MEIKELSSKNIPQITQLENDNPSEWRMYDKPDQKELEFQFTHPHCRTYGMYDGDALIGWGAYRTKYNEDSQGDGIFEINSVFVASKYRGEGLGEKILKKVVTDLKNNETCKKIFLTVSPLNASAIILYLKNNFIIYDYKKNYYGENNDRVFLLLV